MKVIFVFLFTFFCITSLQAQSSDFSAESSSSVTSNRNSNYNGNRTNFSHSAGSRTQKSYKGTGKNYPSEYYSNSGTIIESGDYYIKPKGPYDNSMYSDDNRRIEHDSRSVFIK